MKRGNERGRKRYEGVCDCVGVGVCVIISPVIRPCRLLSPPSFAL